MPSIKLICYLGILITTVRIENFQNSWSKKCQGSQLNFFRVYMDLNTSPKVLCSLIRAHQYFYIVQEPQTWKILLAIFYEHFNAKKTSF